MTESNPAAQLASRIEKEIFPQRFGGYELLERIGQGGMGVVYKARQISLNRMVAVKVLSQGAWATKEQLLRFRTEAAAAGSLRHPNIVAIHEVGLCQDRHFLVMDFVDGHTLAEVADRGPLAARRAAGYIRKIAEAIHHAHERGILHRDLKPSNLLIDAADEPRITDFGLAKRLESTNDLTITGQVLGSPQYMPPEQAAGRQEQVRRPSDVYALGAVLYHLLTGRPPFVGATLSELLPQVINDDPLHPRRLVPALSQDLETICLKCLEKEVSRRYPSALALAEELGRFLRGEPILAQPIGPAGKAWRWCRRKPTVAAASGIVMLTALAGFLGITCQWRRATVGELVARQNAYAADMKEVQRGLEDSDLRRARELLDRYRPAAKAEIDLRGWEWRYFWSRCQSDESSTLCRNSNSVWALAFSADGRWLAMRQDEGKVALWDAVARQRVAELAADWHSPKALAFSPQWNLLAHGGHDADRAPLLSVLDVSAHKEIASLRVSAPLRSIAFSPDAKQIAALSADGWVRVCEVTSQRVVTQFLTASLDRQRTPFKGWTTERGQPGEMQLAQGARGKGTGARTWTASNLFVSHYGSALFSPDGRWLAVGEAAPRIRLLDRLTGDERVLEAPPPADGITTLAFSPDGRLLAAGCGVFDNDVHVWDLAVGTELRLAGHSGWIAAVAFSPDGQTLASGSVVRLHIGQPGRCAGRRSGRILSQRENVCHGGVSGSTDALGRREWSAHHRRPRLPQFALQDRLFPGRAPSGCQREHPARGAAALGRRDRPRRRRAPSRARNLQHLLLTRRQHPVRRQHRRRAYIVLARAVVCGDRSGGGEEELARSFPVTLPAAS